MNELAMLLRRAWEEGSLIDRLFLTENAQPLAGGEQDQESTTDHPLWDIVRWMPSQPYWDEEERLRPQIFPAWNEPWATRLTEAGATRRALCQHYAWSIPTPGDLEWITSILNGRSVVEVGAGTGYWAWQLEQCGVDVVAYEPHPAGEGNHLCTGKPFTTIHRDDATAAARHPDRVLLLVWPPYEGDAAVQALDAYTGDTLIYAGEGWGGCTANDAFYEQRLRDWREIGSSRQHVTWWGIHCTLAVYRRS